MILNGIEAVIFDMDGTLTDSMWIWPEVDRIFLKKYDLTPPAGFQKALEGKSYTETRCSLPVSIAHTAANPSTATRCFATGRGLCRCTIIAASSAMTR